MRFVVRHDPAHTREDEVIEVAGTKDDLEALVAGLRVAIDEGSANSGLLTNDGVTPIRIVRES